MLIVNFGTLLLVLVTYLYPVQFLRIILGIPFLLFAPGYTLAAALLYKKGMKGIEMIALSFGLSLAVVPLIGFALNYTPWGIRLDSVLSSVALFVFTTSVIAWLRQRRLPETQRKAIQSELKEPEYGKGLWDKALNLTMAIAIIGALWTTSYFFIKPKGTEVFTQFYIVEQAGEAASRNLKLGEQGSVGLAIANHEGCEVSYRIQVLIDGNKIVEAGPINLADKQEWQAIISYVPQSAGDNQKLEFLLYKDSGTEPYLDSLYLWVNVN